MPKAQRTLAALQARSEGALTDGTLRPNESIEAVWLHLREGLEALAARGGDQLDLNENGLTQRLVRTLERRPEPRPYFFQKEDMEDDRRGHSPRTDIGAWARDGSRFVVNGIPCAGGNRFLALEAKRLPTPGTGREREYLSGERGGVARFKLGVHGGGLKTLGVIGYIQRHAFDHWRVVINGWVDDLIAASKAELPWDELDRLLLEEEFPRVAVLRSSNLRTSDNERLDMRHLWVQLANEA